MKIAAVDSWIAVLRYVSPFGYFLLSNIIAAYAIAPITAKNIPFNSENAGKPCSAAPETRIIPQKAIIVQIACRTVNFSFKTNGEAIRTSIGTM